jgi:type I restriction enzyme R subunit
LVKKLAQGVPGAGLPPALQNNREAAVLYNNLSRILQPDNTGLMAAEPTPEYGDERLQMALRLDAAIKANAPSGFRGDEVKERIVLNTIHKTLGKTREATLAVFDIVKNQPGY